MNSGKNYKALGLLIVAGVVLCCADSAFAGNPISGAIHGIGRVAGCAANTASGAAGTVIGAAGSIIHGAGAAIGGVLDAIIPG